MHLRIAPHEQGRGGLAERPVIRAHSETLAALAPVLVARPRGDWASRCVYTMRMARVNVYLPDDLAARAREAGLNVSGLTREALEDALAQTDTDRWLERLEQLPRTVLSHERVIEALDDARNELGS